MPKSWWYRLIFLLFTIGLAVLHVAPTVLPNIDLKKFPIKQRLNLGLDLQGGLYLIMGVQFPEVYKESLLRNIHSMESDLKKQGASVKKIALAEKSDPLDPTATLEIDDSSKVEEARAYIRKNWESVIQITAQNENKLELKFTSTQLNYLSEKTVSQSIEVIRNRIDEFGVSEPAITSHGKDKILLELPGVKDVERAKSLIGQTAKLEFQIVEDQIINQGQLQGMVEKVLAANKEQFPEDLKLSEYAKKMNALLAKEIPENTEIAFERVNDHTGKNTSIKIPYLLQKQVDVTGEDLQDAFVSVNQQDNMPFVSLSFNFRGAEKFERVTGANVRRRLAIVLDGVVHSAPVLQQKISGGHAQITMGRGNYNEVLKEATDLAIVLRAGALPAQLEFLEQRIVGPSLGADSILSGKKASYIAFFLIIFFMIFYYRGSGLVANVALSINALFIFAALIILDATLTLPGIAGIALTLGMAVDANIIIYERIREELRSGKSPQTAIELGFARAFASILDSNLTTALAGLVLMEFGTGPVRGFAVTLLMGITTSMYTAIFASRILFDYWICKPEKQAKAISI